MPATKPNTDSAVDSGFDADWNQAMQRYQAGITAGYNDDDAKALYLEPVEQKYKIIASVPPAMQKKAASELDQAQSNLFRNFNAGYTLDDSQKMTLDPVQDKWQAAADIKEPAKADPLLDEKQGALSEVAAGYDPQQVLQGHPRQIFADPAFVTRFEETADRGQRERRNRETKATTAAAKATDTESKDLAEDSQSLFRLNNLFNTGFTNMPADIQQPVKNRIATLHSRIDSAQDGTPKNVQFQSPDAVRAAFKSGQLSQDQAKKILQDQFRFN